MRQYTGLYSKKKNEKFKNMIEYQREGEVCTVQINIKKIEIARTEKR